MPSPILVFAFILATMFGALFHLIVGGDVRRLALYLSAGWLGFTLGHILGMALDISFLRVGSLYALPASIGSILSLVAARVFIVRPQSER